MKTFRNYFISLIAVYLFQLSPLTTPSAQAYFLGLREIRCLSTQDQFLRGPHDEIYLLISVSRSDGTSWAVRVPAQSYWSMSPRDWSAVYQKELLREPLGGFQHSIITLTLVESDGDPEVLGFNRARDIAYGLSFKMRMIQNPHGGRSFLGQMNWAELMTELDQRSRPLDDDTVIGQALIEVWNDGAGVRIEPRAARGVELLQRGVFESTFRFIHGSGQYLISTELFPYL